MALTVTKIGVNDDGTPHLHHHDPIQHAVFTRYVQGVITLADGSTHNVGNDWTFVPTPEHAAELAEHVTARLIDDGHPLEGHVVTKRKGK